MRRSEYNCVMEIISEVSDPIEFDKYAKHVTQSFEWGEFRAKTPTIKKVLRLGSDRRVFQILFSKVPYLPFTIGYLPRSPMPNAEELVEIKKYCQKEKAIFLKIEPLARFTVVTGSQFTVGEPVLPQHTIYIDLTKSDEQLLKEMHEKTRYNIRLAEKKGVVVKEENTQEGLEKFIKILEATEQRQGFYSHTAGYYRLLWKTLHESKIPHILSAYVPNHPNIPIASIMLFYFKDFLYYPYGGSKPEFREFMAPQLLHWEAIKLGKKLGCKTYDLWGSYKNTKTESDPFWGIYRLKSGFGGTEIDFPDSVDIPLSPLYPIFITANKFRWALLKLRK